MPTELRDDMAGRLIFDAGDIDSIVLTQTAFDIDRTIEQTEALLKTEPVLKVKFYLEDRLEAYRMAREIAEWFWDRPNKIPPFANQDERMLLLEGKANYTLNLLRKHIEASKKKVEEQGKDYL